MYLRTSRSLTNALSSCCFHHVIQAAGDLLRRTRGFFLWLQRNFVFVVLIDCALAQLLAEGSIVVSEIFGEARSH